MAEQKAEQYKAMGVSMKPSMARRVLLVARRRGQTRSEFIRELVVKELDSDNSRRQGDGQQDRAV